MDMLDELERAFDRRNANGAECMHWCNELEHNFPELIRLARAGRRYEWLRNNSVKQFEHPIVVSQEKKPQGGMLYLGPVCGEALDKAIDAALSATKEPK